jgi:type IV secretion system protein VirD4
MDVISALVAQLLALFVFIYLMFNVMKFAFKTLFGIKDIPKIGASGDSDGLFSGIIVPFRNIITLLTLKPIKAIFGFLFASGSNDGMMSNGEAKKLFSGFNKGLVIDGKDKRLSPILSFNHMALFARAGGGKTSSYIIPNILKLAEGRNSMVITDLSGELYQATSGHLSKKGYKIYVIDPEHLDQTHGYNPLYYVKNALDVDAIAEILIKSANVGQISAGDKIWYDGAKKLISMLIKMLLNTHDHRYINLANLNHLINNFGSNGSPLDPFVAQYADDNTYNEWKGFVLGNPSTVQSYVSTASMALSSIGINDQLALLLTNHSVNFNTFRSEKSVLYLKVSENKQEQYSFLLNLIYKQFFNVMMEKLPSNRDLDVYCLLDEFGNMLIPNFSTTITTIRKYRVSISIVLQDINQLEAKYGQYDAKSIINGGISGKLFFSGAGLEITKMLSQMIGDQYVNQMDELGQMHHIKEPIMSNAEIRTMGDNEVLFLYGNKKPLKLQVTPYFENFIFKSYTRSKPYQLHKQHNYKTIEYIPLEADG